MKINWNIFNVKYDKCQQSAFEELAYQLFCAHFGNRIGLFRYKNQTGIETELFEKNAKYYGFQAKYYTTTISQNKNDIIDSIQKAKKKNKNLNTVFLYLNKELSESKKKSKKKPQYQFDIENAATKVGVAILWQVPSQIELQLSLPENKYIYDEFFELHYSLGNLIDGILAHNINILDPICTEILFNA